MEHNNRGVVLGLVVIILACAAIFVIYYIR
jgi:hypothetical protein